MIPNSEFQERIKKLQALMKKEGYDFILAYGNEAEPQYVRYLSDYWPSFETAGVLVSDSGDVFLLIGPESYTYAKDRSRLGEIRLLKAFRESSDPEYPGKKLDTFESVFAEMGKTKVKRFGVAGYSLMSIGVYKALQEVLTPMGVEVEKADGLLNSLRMIKSENELNCQRIAAEITHKTMDYVIANIKEGMSETQVVGLALSKMHELGAERESYPLWVLTGDGSDQAISRPRNKILEKGRITFLQVGARYAGYASTIGRPIVLGKASDEEKALIMAGYTIQKEVIGMMKEGVEARAVAQRHLELVKELGFADYYLYGPFHGNGLMEGEAPWVELDSDYKLQENMTFCADIFLGNHSKKHGLRIEDVIKVGKDCAENLTNYPREIFEI